MAKKETIFERGIREERESAEELLKEAAPKTPLEAAIDKATGYAETVHVVYDPDVLGLERLLQIYFMAIDPTSLNKQGEDTGTRYRTGIYYSDPADLPAIRNIYDRVAGEVKAPLAVEVKPLKNFYRAEDYHQDYLIKNPQGYCHISKALMEYARTANEHDSDTD